jgi:hypothetical protein
MSKLESVVDELRALPPHKLSKAARLIHSLAEGQDSTGHAALAAAAETLTQEEADEWERIINEDCRQINERPW